MSRLDELIVHLRAIHPSPEPALAALRVPPACYELSSVATACEPSLTRLCDFHDAAALLEARDVIRGILRLLPQHAELAKNDYRSINDVPENGIDAAYRALPLHQPIEPWWRETLREALLARLVLSPAANTIELLASALRRGLPISLGLRQRQNSPAVRIALLAECLTIEGAEYAKLTHALTDTVTLLDNLPAPRREALHPENAAQLAELRKGRQTPAPTRSPRERLARLARDTGVIALAQRREFHAPPPQRLSSVETLHELIRRAGRWNESERTALQATLVLGRLGCHILRTDNQDPHCRIEHHLHEAWAERRLPDMPEFRRKLEGPGYAQVGRVLHLPLPRRLGHAVATMATARDGNRALRDLHRKLRDLSRDSSQPVTIRRVSRVLEHELEHETPDEAVMTLLGMQAEARRDAGIHYFAPSASELTRRYHTAVEHIVASLDLDVLDDGWSVPPTAPTPFIGYSYRADADTFRSLIASLQATAELGRGRTNSERVIEAYNARVARLTLMYLAATGTRPTGTVLPRRGDISLDDRAAIASEKDALGYRSTRLVPLSARLIVEIREFERWASSKGLLAHIDSPDSPLAMLRAADGTFATPSIIAIKEVVAGFAGQWLWPDDMLRHLFRSRLWEMGCPSSWLRRLMGHHPRHGATDMPWSARPQWEGLHDWSHRIDEHLDELGF